jgi:predicted PurR-regulated permease PerM
MKRSSQDPAFELPSRRVVLLLVLVAVLVWLARPVIGPFVVAAVIAYAFSPIVGAVRDRTGLPRALIALAGIVGAVVLIGLTLWAFGPAVSRELDMLIRGGPDAVALLLRQVIGSDSITIGTRTITVKELGDELQSALTGMLQSPGTALRYAEEVSTIALDSVLVLIVTFYLLVDGTRFRDVALRFLAPGDRTRALRIVDRIQVVLGRWLRGQLLLVIFVAVVVYVVLGPILGVPYSGAIAVLTGVLEIVPLVGPLIAAAIAGTIAFSAGGAGEAVTVLVFYTVLRQIEDQVIMPIVIGRAVHLHPVVTIFAVLVGLSTFGILGGLLAVPTAAAVNVALHEFYADELGPLEDEESAGPPNPRDQTPVPPAGAPVDPASG